MPNAARLLTFLVATCSTVQGERLSVRESQLLRHFAHNHASKKKVGSFNYARHSPSKGKRAELIQLRRSMRFKAGRLAEHAQTKPADINPYTYAAPTGNGNMDLATPFYGSYSHNYGPVYQLLTPVSGYGGFPSTVDPRGFNAQTENYTHGVLASDLGMQSDKPNILGKNAGLMSNPAAGGLLSVNSLRGLPAGSIPPFTGLPFAHQALHLTPGGPHTVIGQISGTIPVMFPSGMSKGMLPQSTGMVRPGTLLPSAGMGVVPGVGLVPGRVPGFPGAMTGFGVRSPYNPSFSVGMMQHRQMTLNGAANGFATPGFFHPMSVNYPTPDMDRYSSVRSHPVRPPNYGNEFPKGSGAKPKA